jgi:recombination protein RecA
MKGLEISMAVEKKNARSASKNKTSKDSNDNKKKALELALQQIEKNYGKGAVMRLGENLGMNIDAIPTGSLMLDAALGIGGLPRGRIIEIYGPEASGKTTLALHVIAEAQKMGGEAAFIDVEHALDPVYSRALGVDVDSLLVSQPDTGEQALEIAEALIRSGAIDIVVIDSVAALVPRAEIEGEMGDAHVGLQARLMSQAMRKLAGAVSKSNCMAIFINQLRLKVGVVYGNPEVTAGGNALKYYSSVRLDVRRTETLKAGGESIGSHTRVRVVKNKVAPPFKEAEFDIMYGEGISREGEVLDVAVKLDIIQKAGSWFSYKDSRLAQGRDNVKSLLKQNPELMEELEQLIRENIDKLNPAGRNIAPITKQPKEIPIEAAAKVTASAAKAKIDISVDD